MIITLNILVRELYDQEIKKFIRLFSKRCWNVLVSQGINQSGAVWENKVQSATVISLSCFDWLTGIVIMI